MVTIEQAKQMAERLHASLQAHHQVVPWREVLELVAQQIGFKDWSTASAMLPQARKPHLVTFEKAIPILHMADEARALDFYLAFLGFSIEFEHRFSDDLPLYLGISRNGLRLHLSAHEGDVGPGSTIFVPTQNIERLRDELNAKRYGSGRAGIVVQAWGKVLEVQDPSGNRIRFCEA
jgi:catechol 2,3-dioxygenase-like lactoylglutathione lyase family enzyme